MHKLVPTLLLTATFSLPLIAVPVSFDFKDPKGVNSISFLLDSLLEPISGTASDISGMVDFDVTHPEKLSGKIVIATESLTVTNDTMREHLLSNNWLNATANPEIVFQITELKMPKTDGNTTTGTAVGLFTLKGVTKEISVPVKITHLVGAFGKRINKPEAGGDLLVVRGTFNISRTDYDIRPGQNEDKVADVIELSLALVGSAPNA
jgi:polyisoprenoid-binding protein YceI